ncbi:MAG: polysaccharide pyruvyl transferase family protein [Vicinamibacterales bacterium]
MRILIDSGSYHALNVGDVAMLQAGIERLRQLWPDASIAVVTNSPAALATHCPGVRAVPLSGRVAFRSDRFFGRANDLLPQRLGAGLDAIHDRMQQRWPATLAAIIAGKRAMALRRDWLAAPAYIRALKVADLVVATGAGVLTDAFLENATGVLETLAFAIQRNVPTAAFGQGIGPVSSPALRRRMSEVLPHLALIALRERRESVRLLAEIGVHPDRIIVTGDDAIEMASRGARPEFGDAIGVNVRVAGYAGVTAASAIDVVGPAVRRAAGRLAAPLLAVPIAHHPDCHDGIAIRELLTGGDDSSAPLVSLDTPARAIAQVSRCRVVVTGSYHAAVFALAQGIPVVALAATRYYVDKFSGLQEFFGDGCRTVVIGSPDAAADLEAAIVEAWAGAPARREALRCAADEQVRRGRNAYQLLGRLIDGRADTGPLPVPRPVSAHLKA